jgi:hypothetical protein
VHYDVTSRACHAAPTLGYCSLQYTTTVETPTGTRQTPWHMTLVARSDGAAWQIVHLHNALGG